MKSKLFLFFLSISVVTNTLGQSEASLKKENSQLFNSSVVFTENKGQVVDKNDNLRHDVLFTGVSEGILFYIRRDGISYVLTKNVREGGFSEESVFPQELLMQQVDINWQATQDDIEIEYGEKIPGYNNYILPSCPEGIYGVNSYDEVTIKNIYSGIDIRLYSIDNHLEYDFVLGPGTDYNQIKWSVEGADEFYIKECGDLVIKTGIGEIHEQVPIAFQENKTIGAKWEIVENYVRFKLDPYDCNLALIIDPAVRKWGTYYGGTSGDYASFTTTDNSSNVYVSGYTSSTTSIATNVYHNTYWGGGSDAFIVKFNSNGIRQWATYYGGTGADWGRGCAVDDSGYVYLSGSTRSNGTIAGNGHQNSFGGNQDAFLVKFSSSGNKIWGTYYGGSINEYGRGCTVDNSGNIYLTGYTDSKNNIASTGAHQDTLSGTFYFTQAHDAFLVKFSRTGTRLWGTYYGADEADNGNVCVTDNSMNVYIAGSSDGHSSGSGFTTAVATTGSHQSTPGGVFNDGFIAKFDSNGVRQWGTYYGGTTSDWITSMDCNGAYLYVAGTSHSTNNIASTGAFQSSNPNSSSFLVKFNLSGVRQWGTYFGSSVGWNSTHTRAFGDSLVFLTGSTSATTGIATSGSYQTSHGGGGNDIYVSKFDEYGNRIRTSYYGDSGNDAAQGISLASNSDLFICGNTTSGSGLSSYFAHQSSYGGSGDAFLVKMSHCPIIDDTIKPEVCDSFVSPSGQNVWYITGNYVETFTSTEGCDSLIHVELTVVNTPVLMTTPGNVCDSGTVTLGVSGLGFKKWYDVPTGGLPLGNGTSFTTPSITSTTTFYVESNVQNCFSPRLPVIATVNNSSKSTIDVTECLSYTSPSGQYIYDSSGTYFDTLSNAQFCDSVITINLTINHVDTSVSSDGRKLSAGANSATFQWIDCSTYSAVTGATSSVFSPSTNGNYAVAVTQNNCTDTTSCFEVSTVGLQSSQPRNVRVFPNPASDVLHIQFGQRINNVKITILNDFGQAVMNTEYEDILETYLDLNNIPSGIYLIKFDLDGESKVYSIIKE